MKHKLNGLPLRYWMGKPYTYLLGQTMALCSEHISTTSYRDELIAYVFENGHPNQGDANMFWSQLSEPRYADRAKHYRYASHTFVDGKGPLGSVLQLCDILAWNMNKWRRENAKTPKLVRLFDTPTMSNHHDPPVIMRAIEMQVSSWREREKNNKSRRAKPV